MGSRQIKSGDSSVRCEEGTVRVDAPDGFFVNGDISVGGTGGSDGSSQFSGVTEGGQVIWSSAYTFRVAAAIYYIQGIRYTSIEQTISLNTAHATLDRIDVIVLGTDELVAKVTGTAAAQPSEPDFDPSTQVKLTFVYVAAASSAPSGVSNEDIYLENTEWTSSTSGSGFNANSTNNPRTSSKSIEGTTVANAAYVQLERGSSETLDSFATLIIFIRSKATWNANRGLRVQFLLAGVAKGSPVTIADGYWGYSSAITSGYQLVAIPISQFVLPFGQLVNQLRITDFGGSIGFYLDDISLQTSSTAVGENGSSGITQEAADERYLGIEYKGIPQNSQSAAYTTVLADAGKHILHPTADNNARTFTIAANSSVAYPIGTVITILNEINTITVAIASDTLKFVGDGTTGSRTLAANGMATAIKTGATTWWISGVGIT
mgnify:CR=1 FL=1